MGRRGGSRGTFNRSIRCGKDGGQIEIFLRFLAPPPATVEATALFFTPIFRRFSLLIRFFPSSDR